MPGMCLTTGSGACMARFETVMNNPASRSIVFLVPRLAVCALLFLSIGMPVQRSVAAGARANFILFIADDMAWDDCGAYGHPGIRTPNLDRLAGDGMRFDRAFLTASSCSPSRASIITGRYPHQTDAEQLHWPLPPEQITFVEQLRTAGYWTAAAGKWHLGDAMTNRFNRVLDIGTAGFQLPSGAAAQKARMVEKGSDDLQSGCRDWVPVLRDRPRDRPFFLWLAALDPHRDYEENIIPNPYRPGEVRVPPYLPDVEKTRKDLALYYNEITRLDRYVGEVLAELEKQGETRNTFVIFISDNGRPFPRDKTTVYDSGIKTPWIVRWPGRVEAGSTCASLVSSVDLAPTFLDLAGVRAPALFEGVSFAPLLKDPRATVREFVFAEQNWHDYEARSRAVRTARYKYILNEYNDLPLTPPADGVRSPTYTAMRQLRETGQLTPEQSVCFVKPRPREEFYDTAKDPFEMKNLSGDPAWRSELERLRAVLTGWKQKTGDITPAHRTADEFDRGDGTPLANRVRPRPSKAAMQRAD
jgi:N-sulfoglucosamine sulfohydrolase